MLIGWDSPEVPEMLHHVATLSGDMGSDHIAPSYIFRHRF